MGIDVASLAVKIDSTEAKDAAGNLDKLTAAGGKAENSVNKFGGEAERAAKKTKTASDQANNLTSSYKQLTGAIAALGLAKITADIASTNAEFQKLNSMLKVATGSSSAAAAAFGEIKKFAAETPFELAQSVEAFIRLKNLGLNPTMETMRSFGNTASSMGKDMMQFVEAVADAATGEFERLKEFGIKASKAGGDVTFVFQGAATTVKNSSAEIQKYLEGLGNVQFAGAMAEQMDTLGGKASNLKDSIDALYVKIGELGANKVFSEALTAAAQAVVFLSDNMQTLIDVGGALVIGLVSYKATLLATTAAQALMSGQLGILIGSVGTVTAEFGLLAGAQVAASGAAAALTVAFRALTASMLANPAGWLAAGIGILVGGIYLLSRRSEEAAAAQENLSATSGALARVTEEATKRTSELASTTGAARKEALQNVEALKAEAERYLAVAGAAAVAARAKALAAYQNAQNVIDAAPGGTRAYKEGTFAAQQATKAAAEAEAAANKASDEWLKWNEQVGQLEKQIESATKPITLAATATDKVSKSTKEADDATKEYEKNVKELIDTLKDLPNLLFEISQNYQTLQEGMANKSFADAVKAANDNLDKTHKPLKDAADANAEWNDQLRETIRWLDKIGGAGRSLGDVAAIMLGLSSGDFSGVSGKGGALIEMLSGVQWTGTKDGERYIYKLGEEFQKSLEGVFGKNFGPTFLNLAQGAGTGAAIGGIVFGGNKYAQLGSMAGGAAGQALGAGLSGAGEALSFLGNAAGPIGAVVGTILGGILGGALAPTQRGSATFTGSGQLSSRGNNNDMIAASSGIGNAILDTFSKIADAFDATLNDFKFSVGIREGNLRYDPTGQGITKTANGAINFGQDQAALIEYAVRQALSNGVFEGLSDGVKRILDNTEGGNFETQLKKALSFQSVFKELDSIKNPLGTSLDSLNAQFEELRSTFKEAGASAEQAAKLEELYGIKRAEIIDQTNRAILEKERPVRELEIQLMQAQGKTAEALAASRQLELDGMTEQEAALQKQINRWTDVNQKYAENLAASARWKVLNDQALELSGKTEVLRRNELATMSEAEQELQKRIWALQDEKVAAEEAARAADDLARAQQAIASERYGLETRLLQLQGNTNALRQRELEALDPSNRAIQEQINAIEDRKAAEQKAIQAAQEVMAQRNDMISSYQREASSLSSFIDKFNGLAASIREFRAGLFTANDNSAFGFAAARTAFQNTSRMAALGNETSLQSFVGVSQNFLSAARDNAASLVDYQRAIGLVAGAADAAASGAEGVARQASQQLQAIQSTVSQLEALNAATQENIDTLNNLDNVQQADVVPTLEALLSEQQGARDDMAAIRKDQQAETMTMVQALNTVARLLSRWDRGDAAAVTNDSDTPLTTVVAA